MFMPSLSGAFVGLGLTLSVAGAQDVPGEQRLESLGELHISVSDKTLLVGDSLSLVRIFHVHFSSSVPCSFEFRKTSSSINVTRVVPPIPLAVDPFKCSFA